MDQWLVRTINNVIAGPFTKEQVCQLIREGQLNNQDEVCKANDYWFTLHEREEVMRQLGVEVPKAGAEEEVTETQNEALLEKTDPDVVPEVSPELSQAQDQMGENTGVMSSRPFRELQPKKAPGHPGAFAPTTPAPSFARLESRYASTHPGGHGSSSVSSQPQVMVQGESVSKGIERPAVWRSFAWILIILACLIVYAVLRILRNH